MDYDDVVLKIICPQCKKAVVSHNMERAMLCTYLMTAVMFNMKLLDKDKERGGFGKDVDWDSLDKHGV